MQRRLVRVIPRYVFDVGHIPIAPVMANLAHRGPGLALSSASTTSASNTASYASGGATPPIGGGGDGTQVFQPSRGGGLASGPSSSGGISGPARMGLMAKPISK